jgi:multidrug efflux pump
VFSRFFIDRPIFAAVLSIIITLAGGVAVFTLPIAQYPPIAPPMIMVQCNYAGASAAVVAEAVAAPIEQQVNGVEGMMYMSSQCTNDGNYSLSVTFKPGINLSFAQVLVQNRVNLALPQLPDVVRQTGVTTRKRSPDILLIVSLNSPKGSKNQLYLSNYALTQLRDELLRIDGVGDVIMFGQRDYSMRVWVNPDQLYSRNLTASDVVSAIREENQQVPSGQLGQPPLTGRQAFQQPLKVRGRLEEPKEFDDIVVKQSDDGTVVRIKEVGHCELGAKNEDIHSRIDGKPCANIAVFQLPDANALDTADRVRAKVVELAKHFPPDVDYDIAYDTTPYVRESVKEVFNTLRDSVILVAIVVLVFLQNWRSALIPLVAVPVAIIGTFAVMAAFGFSLNNLTLFGLVLAIGIVVDDAIVVVEAVEHHIETGLSPRDATIKAMGQVSGPVVAVALVLSAVFVPCAFISGITGQFFRQFALTIAVSTVISAFNSLTLSPALAAILLPARGAKKDVFGRLLHGVFGWFFRGFNFSFARATNGYTRAVRKLLRGSAIVLFVYGGLLAVTWVGFSGLPKIFIPYKATAQADPVHPGRWRVVESGTVLAEDVDEDEARDQAARKGYKDIKVRSWNLAGGLPVGYIPPQDKGYLLVSVQLPDAASLERTKHIITTIDRICLGDDLLHERAGWPLPGPGEKKYPGMPGRGHTLSVSGQSFTLSAYGSNFGNFFFPLDDFSRRRDPSLHSDVIAENLRKAIEEEIPGAVVAIFGPPPVNGLGTAGGIKFIVEDRGDLGLDILQKQVDNLIEKSKEVPQLNGLFTVSRVRSPQLYADVDRERCAAMNIPLQRVFDTLGVYLGSLYVNDFNKFGRTWQVIVQAEAPFRDRIDRIKRLQVRSNNGDMVPLGSLCKIKEINGPLIIGRYNMYTGAAINGNTAVGVSSGEAIKVMEGLADRELAPRMGYDWTELTYLQLISGNTATIIFVLAVVFVFLVLAAQYESWSLPLAVILVVPMCLFGSITGVIIANSDINIFTQIGFVVLVGLASKNAILIVEFAKKRYEAGEPVEQAALEACQLRLRPILMTSFAFILGVLPLLTSKGAGAEMRHTLGTAVFSGMLGVTLFGIFVTPVFFLVVERASKYGLFESLSHHPANAFVLRYVLPALLCVVVGGLAYEVSGGGRWAAVIISVLTVLGAVGFFLVRSLLSEARLLRRPPETALLKFVPRDGQPAPSHGIVSPDGSARAPAGSATGIAGNGNGDGQSPSERRGDRASPPASS